MKVKYIGNNFDEFFPEKEYSVLELLLGFNGFKYRLIAEDYEYSALYSVEDFIITDHTLYKDWIINKIDSNLKSEFYELIPKAWNYTEFWENFYNGNKKEKEIFYNEIQKMKL